MGELLAVDHTISIDKDKTTATDGDGNEIKDINLILEQDLIKPQTDTNDNRQIKLQSKTGIPMLFEINNEDLTSEEVQAFKDVLEK